MERGISASKRRFLADESRKWADDGIITLGQRDVIMNGYAVTRRFPAAVHALGAAMIGVGVLCVIAANWMAIPRIMRIIIIVGSYIGSMAGAYACEKKGRPAVSGVLLLLSGFLLLGGLALLSQIFNIDGDIDGLLLTWLVVYAPTFFAARGVSVFALYEIVAGAYISLAFYHYGLFNHLSNFYGYGARNGVIFWGPWRAHLLLFAVTAAAWLEWSRWSDANRAASRSRLRDFFVGGATRRIMMSNYLIILWISCMAAINSNNDSPLPYVMSVLAVGAAIQVAAWRLCASDLDWQALAVISLSGFALTFAWSWMDHMRYDDFTVETVVSSVALGLFLVWRILRRGGKGWAVFFFCLLLARWYFDMFFGFMDKGIFFLAGGALLIAIGAAYAKWNRLLAAKKEDDSGE